MFWIKEICVQQYCHENKTFYIINSVLYILCAKFHLPLTSNDWVIAYVNIYITCK